MKDTTKRTLGIISFLPLVAFVLWVIYLMFVNKMLIDNNEFQQHERVSTLISSNYGNLFIYAAIAAIIGAGVLLYFVIHLARLRHMNGATKLGWIIFMVVFGAASFPIFWWLEIRNEPENIQYYPSIK